MAGVPFARAGERGGEVYVHNENEHRSTIFPTLPYTIRAKIYKFLLVFGGELVLGVGEQGGLVLLGEEVTAFGEQGRVEGVERGNLLGLLGVNWEGRREAGGVFFSNNTFLLNPASFNNLPVSLSGLRPVAPHRDSYSAIASHASKFATATTTSSEFGGRGIPHLPRLSTLPTLPSFGSAPTLVESATSTTVSIDTFQEAQERWSLAFARWTENIGYANAGCPQKIEIALGTWDLSNHQPSEQGKGVYENDDDYPASSNYSSDRDERNEAIGCTAHALRVCRKAIAGTKIDVLIKFQLDLGFMPMKSNIMDLSFSIARQEDLLTAKSIVDELFAKLERHLVAMQVQNYLREESAGTTEDALDEAWSTVRTFVEGIEDESSMSCNNDLSDADYLNENYTAAENVYFDPEDGDTIDAFVEEYSYDNVDLHTAVAGRMYAFEDVRLIMLVPRSVKRESKVKEMMAGGVVEGKVSRRASGRKLLKMMGLR